MDHVITLLIIMVADFCQDCFFRLGLVPWDHYTSADM